MGRFLYLSLFVIIVFAAPLWASLGKNPKSKTLKITTKETPKKVLLRNTKDPKEALDIFNTFGLPGWMTIKVYDRKDRKTGILYGHAICKGLFLEYYADKEFLNAESAGIYLPADVYKKGDKSLVSDNEIFLRGVLCYYGKGKNDYLFVTNGRDSHYYIFEGIEGTFVLQACLHVERKTENYPKVEICGTEDHVQADSIFGKFGAMPAKDKMHICSERNKPIELCKKVLQKIKLGSNYVSFRCVDKIVYRYFTKKEVAPSSEQIEYEKGPTVRAAICVYNKIDSKLEENTILVFNPPKKPNSFYVAEEVTKGNDVWLVRSVVEVS